ncbi:MAG: hypothetical protein M3N22_03150 [Acidobacteriota bacterium]|nr:hypothetical protein [Acidobacteriota bacterium]
MRSPLCCAVLLIFAGSAVTIRSQEISATSPFTAKEFIEAAETPAIRSLARMPSAARLNSSLSGADSSGADSTGRNLRETHNFWDKENDWLFAGVAGSRALDYSSTLNMRRRGRQEIFLTNEIVDNHAAFAVIEAAGTGVSMGACYIFHRYGHHKLERWTSIVHIGLATTGAVRNYSLKTVH